MSLFKSLFPTLAEVKTATSEKEALEKKLEARDKRIEELQDSKRELAQSYERSIEEKNYSHRRALSSLERELKEADERNEKALSFYAEDSRITADNIEMRADLRVEKEALEYRKEVRKEVEALMIGLREALVNEAAAMSTAEAQEDTIKSLKAQIADYNEMIKFISSKIPTVDLSSFNINVDVQPAEVNVSGGQQIKKN
jgi:chromosome segregation ATPase